MRIVLRLISTAIALAVAAWLFDGIGFDRSGGKDLWIASGHDEWQRKIVPLLIVAAILGVITSFVKPVLTILSIPLIILTLGLFLLVINAVVLKITSGLADALNIGFYVRGFWPAVGGSIVITIVTWFVDGVVGTDDDR